LLNLETRFGVGQFDDEIGIIQQTLSNLFEYDINSNSINIGVGHATVKFDRSFTSVTKEVNCVTMVTMVAVVVTVADKYGAAKIAKYKTLAEERDGVILPFIVESSGGYGQHALNLLADLQRCACEHAAIASAKDVVNRFLDAVAIGIQRGNALAVRRSVEMTHREEYRTRIVSREHRRMTTSSLGVLVRSGVASVARSLSLQ
jgi:hypothetical protein